MPRLDPHASLALLNSAKHELIAVAAAGELRVLEAADQQVLATEALPGDEVDVGLVMVGGEPRLVAVAVAEGVTRILLFDPRGLTPLAALEIAAPTRALAWVGERILVAGPSGEHPRVITIAPRALTADAIALREPVQAAAPTPDGRMVVIARDQIEVWDAPSRRALQRINLPVERPLGIGFVARQRMLWIAGAAPEGPIDVYRFSDGRPQLRAELRRPIAGVAGVPEASRLMIAIRTPEGEHRFAEWDVALNERRDHRPPAPVAYQVMEGPRPALLTLDAAGQLTRTPLELLPTSIETPMAPPKKKLPEPSRFRSGRPQPPPRPQAPADASAGGDWRSRLGHPRDIGRAALPTGATAAAAPPPPRPAPADEPTRAAQTAAANEAMDLLDRFVGWVEACLSHPGGAPERPGDLDEVPPVATAQRLGLGEAATHALALLWGAWLLGLERGVATAELARMVARLGASSSTAWDEALGRGELARLGLIVRRRGRVRLAAFAAHALDGDVRTVEVVKHDGPPEREIAAPALHRVAPADDLDELARGVARSLGRPVALVDASEPRLPAQLFELAVDDVVPLLVVEEEPPRDLLAGRLCVLVPMRAGIADDVPPL